MAIVKKPNRPTTPSNRPATPTVTKPSGNNRPTSTHTPNRPQRPTPSSSGTSQPAYNPNTDYAALMNDAAARGDYASAALYESLRNQKINGEKLNYEQTNIYGSYLGQQDKYDPKLDEAYQQALAMLQQIQGQTPSFSNEYTGKLEAIYNQIIGRKPFQYDINEDMLYKQYAQQYQDMGRLAMQDTIGQTAALTGGYGNTYTQAVGQQQYDAYLKKFNDVVPQLYGMAYDQYMDEGNKLYQQYAMMGNLADREQQANADAYNRWMAQLGMAQDAANNAYDRGFNQWIASNEQANINRQNQLAADKFNYQKEQDRKAEEAAAAAARRPVYYSRPSGPAPVIENGTETQDGTRKNVTSLDWDQDEGIFTWNGKTYTNLVTLLDAIEAENPTPEESAILQKKLNLYGWEIKIDPGKES